LKTIIWLDSWKTALRETKFRFLLVITVVLLSVILFYYTRFLDYIETRPGAVLDDPILAHFNPTDLTWITFSLIYLSVILALIHLGQNPHQLMIALQSYILLVLARMISMYLLPLDPPVNLIPLEDPFVQSMSASVLKRDLFFSGHTSILVLLYLCSNNQRLKIFFLATTILVGICVIWQHVHYSIDVIAAPFYAYACYRTSLLINQWVFGHRGIK